MLIASKKLTQAFGRAAPKKPLQKLKVMDKRSAKLRLAILDACKEFQENLKTGDKDYLRALHISAKMQNPGFDALQRSALFAKHKAHFREGNQIEVSRIKPVLKLVTDGEWSERFSVLRSLWSMRYNKGYGRRLRFVIYDEYHNGLMGIIGLQSPPADLGCRDVLFEFPYGEKLDRVNSTMDAYTVGAIPPYSYLLGGKLCAGLIASDSIRQAYWRVYANRKSEMQKTRIEQPLAAVTTTSAFGRSSMYNRLKFGQRLIAEPIGNTLGYGTLHLEHLYVEMCDYLKRAGMYTEGGFGNGPKVRWQNIANTLTALHLPGNLLRHGVCREVFLFRLVDDLVGGMRTGRFGNPIALPDSDFAEYWRERWAIPRAARYPAWNSTLSVPYLEETLKALHPQP